MIIKSPYFFRRLAYASQCGVKAGLVIDLALRFIGKSTTTDTTAAEIFIVLVDISLDCTNDNGIASLEEMIENLKNNFNIFSPKRFK